MDQQLIDRIYECSVAPELWPGVLDELAKIADARGGSFICSYHGSRELDCLGDLARGDGEICQK